MDILHNDILKTFPALSQCSSTSISTTWTWHRRRRYMLTTREVLICTYPRRRSNYSLILVMIWKGNTHSMLLTSLLAQTERPNNDIKWVTSRENLSSGVCDQERCKPSCSATEMSYSLAISDITTIVTVVILSVVHHSELSMTSVFILEMGCSSLCALVCSLVTD